MESTNQSFMRRKFGVVRFWECWVNHICCWHFRWKFQRKIEATKSSRGSHAPFTSEWVGETKGQDAAFPSWMPFLPLTDRYTYCVYGHPETHARKYLHINIHTYLQGKPKLNSDHGTEIKPALHTCVVLGIFCIFDRSAISNCYVKVEVSQWKLCC